MTAVDHAELKRLAEGATPGPWDRSEWTHEGYVISSDGVWLGEIEGAKNAAFIAASNPAVVLALLSEIEGLKAERDVLEVERLGLRAAIFGSHDYDPALRHASFIEMARLTEDSRKGALSRAAEAERLLAALRTQAPDSWMPDRGAVRKAVLAMEATIVWDKERGYRMPYRVRDPLYEACSALRPQTESGE